MEFKLGSHWIGDGHPVFIIAEVGINHHGDPEICMQMIEAAAKTGANAIKLQTVDPDESYVRDTTSYKEFKNKSLSDDALEKLNRLAENLQILLFSTPGDFPSLEQMCRHRMPAVKISSGLMTNLPLIAAAAKKDLPLIISTGLAYESEIQDAVQTAQSYGASGVALLKCTALYPSPDETVNALAIPVMARRFGVPVGYSDHTMDDLACLAAVSLGAKIIEKHFTLDSDRNGADHRISMEPEPFAEMVSKIRRLEQILGSGTIEPAQAEVTVRQSRHRCLVAREDIKAGTVFSSENLALKRPMSGKYGLPPSKYSEVLGKFASADIERDQPIKAEQIKGLI
jgi:N,N'-diacetyllegionaminate synthase